MLSFLTKFVSIFCGTRIDDNIRPEIVDEIGDGNGFKLTSRGGCTIPGKRNKNIEVHTLSPLICEALPPVRETIKAVESISYMESPRDMRTAIIRAKIKRHGAPAQVKYLGYDEFIKIKGGKDALRKFDPMWLKTQCIANDA